MIIPLRCVGIDVSKHFLDIFDEAIGACDALVVFEATGVYDLELREALRQAATETGRETAGGVGDHILPLLGV